MTSEPPEVTAFYDKSTGSVQYVVTDPITRRCAIIDPVLDFDEGSGRVLTVNADRLLEFVERQQLTLEWVLETHPHDDHFSAAAYLKARTGIPTATGKHIIGVQELWRSIYNWPDFPADGSQWDVLFDDGDTFWIGMQPVKVLFSPGHTPASVTYLVGSYAFIHDTLLMPDIGTARCDFPGGSAAVLWNSIQRILALPDDTRLFVGHDYCQGGREPKWMSTVADQKAKNIHISQCRTEAEFVAIREARDRFLPVPRLILHALQVNINGGQLPPPEANGTRYLKIPLDCLWQLNSSGGPLFDRFSRPFYWSKSEMRGSCFAR